MKKISIIVLMIMLCAFSGCAQETDAMRILGSSYADVQSEQSENQTAMPAATESFEKRWQTLKARDYVSVLTDDEPVDSLETQIIAICGKYGIKLTDRRFLFEYLDIDETQKLWSYFTSCDTLEDGNCFQIAICTYENEDVARQRFDLLVDQLREIQPDMENISDTILDDEYTFATYLDTYGDRFNLSYYKLYTNHYISVVAVDEEDFETGLAIMDEIEVLTGTTESNFLQTLTGANSEGVSTDYTDYAKYANRYEWHAGGDSDLGASLDLHLVNQSVLGGEISFYRLFVTDVRIENGRLTSDDNFNGTVTFNGDGSITLYIEDVDNFYFDYKLSEFLTTDVFMFYPQ